MHDASHEHNIHPYDTQTSSCFMLQEYDTCGLWVAVPLSAREVLGARTEGAVHAANHALLLAVGVESDSSDLADLDTEHFGGSYSSDDSGGSVSRLLLYDKQPGGSGTCESVYATLQEKVEGAKSSQSSFPSSSILSTAMSVLNTCSCTNGCPACLFLSGCMLHLDKQGGLFLLQEISTALGLGRGESARATGQGDSPSGTGEGFMHMPEESVSVKQMHARVSVALEPSRKKQVVIREVKNTAVFISQYLCY